MNVKMNTKNSYRPILTEEYFKGKPLSIGNKIQLLLGDVMVEDFYRIKHEQQSPEKFKGNPLMTGDLPYENGSVDRGTVIYDEEEQIFKLWCGSGMHTIHWMTNADAGNCAGYATYAESKDGIFWTKPMLDSYPLGRYKTSNIVFIAPTYEGIDIGRVFENPDKSDRKRRFLVAYTGGAGVRMAYSADGRKFFDMCQVSKVPMDCYPSFMFDESRGVWQMFGRPNIYAKPEGYDGEPIWPNANYRRKIVVTESKDFFEWSQPREVFQMPENHFYTEADHITPFAVGDYPLAFVNVFRPEGENWMEQLQRPVLVFGRDMYSLRTLPDSKPIMEPGEENAYDDSSCAVYGYPMYCDGRVYFYYRATPHRKNPYYSGSAPGLMSFGENRFVARVGDEYGGWLLTREFILEGNSIEINCEASAEGAEIRAEILLGENGTCRGGKNIDGYRLEECDAVKVDSLHHTLTWNGSADLSCFEGKPIYIRFNIINSKLYSFQVNK